MASIGLDYIGTEVPLVSRRASFRSLTDMVKHPALSKRITSLFYTCDRLNFDSLQLEKCWATRNHFLEDIPQRPTYELQSLHEWFQCCRNIRQITVASDTGQERRLTTSNTALTALGQTIIENDKKLNWTRIGVRQILNIANAVVAAGVQLDSLTIAGTTHRLWDSHNDEEVSNLKSLIRPLRRLRVSTVAMTEREADCYHRHDSQYMEEPDLNVVVAAFRSMEQTNLAVADAALANSERFRGMLAEATELRILKLQFWPYYNTDDSDPENLRCIDLEHLLWNVQFSHLYELAIGWCGTTSNFLGNAILRHKTTLRRLTLSHIHLLDGDLSRFIDSIAGKLPHLCQVTLRGMHNFNDWQPLDGTSVPFKNEEPDQGDLRHAVESFVLGVGPRPDWDEYFKLHGPHMYDDGFSARDWYGEPYNYRPPTLPEYDATPDDPAQDYVWDEFDDRMFMGPKGVERPIDFERWQMLNPCWGGGNDGLWGR